MRIVSLVPSVTETLREWGIDPVACTRYCEQPDLPTVGGTKTPDVAAIVALRPDLVVVDEEENRLADHEALVAAGVPTHVLAVRSLADVDAQLPGLAAAVGATWEPVGAVPPAPVRLRALVPVWRRPWMAVGPGTYGASLLAALGVSVVPDDAGRYPRFDPAALRPPPDVVLVPDEPYRFRERHLAELAEVAPVHEIGGRDLFWWGVRTRSARRRLGERLHQLLGPGGDES